MHTFPLHFSSCRTLPPLHHILPILAQAPARRSGPDWSSGLPSDLLEFIARRLPSSLDYVCFRSVCSHWRAALPFMSFAPFLMLPFDPESGSVTFYSLSDKRTFTLLLPDVRGKVLCGLSQGWLALMDETAAVTLLNPFTGASVKLPPADERIAAASWRCMSMVDGQWVFHCEVSGKVAVTKLAEMRNMFFNEIILSSAPDLGGECVAMATLANSMQVAFCKVGDIMWTLLESNLSCCVSSVVYCQERFLAISCVGEIASCSVSTAPMATPVPSLTAPEELCHHRYLDVNGALHLVAAVVEVFDEAQCFVYRNEVYKCDLKGKLEWSRVENIGNLTMFVSKNFGASLTGKNVSRFRSNSVYLSEPLYRVQEEQHCLEIVDIATGTSEFAAYCETMQGSDSEGLWWIRPNLLAEAHETNIGPSNS